MCNGLDLSVCMITYNQEDYIREAIEGVLMQETNFCYNLVIGEDGSTDKTRQICEEYSKNNYQLIKLLPSDKNIGMMPNFIRTLNSCAGKYIAICEGDDYWTDPFKLQKQFDFLESNEDFVICFHNARKLFQHTGDTSKMFFEKVKPKVVSNLKDIINEDFIPTLTCVFRNNLIKEFPEWYHYAYPGDWPLHILNAQHGKIRYIDDIMATYRIHKNGVYSGSSSKNHYEKMIPTIIKMKNYLPLPYSIIMANTISKTYYSLAKILSNSNDNIVFLRTFGNIIKYNPFRIFLLRRNPIFLLILNLYRFIMSETKQ